MKNGAADAARRRKKYKNDSGVSLMETRDKDADILKGVSMCLVIWGHCLQLTSMNVDFYALPVFRIIYSFHLPLFTLISGYLLGLSFQKRMFADNIAHRIPTIFWPILTANILYVFLAEPLYLLLIAVRCDTMEPVYQQLKSVIDSGITSRYWFLWNILACSLAAIVIFQKMKRLYSKILMTAVCMFWVQIFPFGSLIFSMFPFFIAGAAAGHFKKNFSRINPWAAGLIVLTFFSLIPFYKNECFIYNPVSLPGLDTAAKFAVWSIRIGCGFCGSLSLVILLKGLRSLCSKPTLRSCRNYLSPASNCLACIGSNSLKFYILQEIAFAYYRPLFSFFSKKFPSVFSKFCYLPVYQFIITPIAALTVIIILYRIILYLNRHRIAVFLWTLKPSDAAK